MPRILTTVVCVLALLGPIASNGRVFADCGDRSDSDMSTVLEVGCFEPDESTTTTDDVVHQPTPNADGRATECQYEYDFTYDPAAPDADLSINMSGRRQHLYWGVAGNPSSCEPYLWIDANDPAAPAITATDLLPGVWVNVQRQLPTPIPRVAPADLAPDGFAFVQMPTFFWVDQALGQWAPVTGSASGGGITVSVRADPVRLIVSTGDGEEVVCEGAPPPFPKGSDPANFLGCEYTYRNSSAMAENGETFPLTVTVEWEASWSATTGEGGSLGIRRTTSETRWLPVAEIQAVIIDTD